MNPTTYWRLRPTTIGFIQDGDHALQEPLGLLKDLRPKHGIILAGWDEQEACALVSYFGVVRRVAASRDEAAVTWRPFEAVFKPNPAGRRWWKQPKPFFKFAASVVERYMLDDLFAECFPEFRDFEFGPPPRVAQPAATPSASPTGGFVYVIRSKYGFKIGKTVNLKDRTRLFAVKLPFSISVEHAAWFEDYTFAERSFHLRFKSKRLEGEWFDLSDGELDQIKSEGQSVSVEGL